MGIKRAIGDLRDLQRSVVELFDDDRSAEAEASLQIARSAQRFSQNTKEVVDDKLSFSATLMRAGEVQAANRLLAEVEHEVREEEAALIETVNEVKVAQSLRRERVTRLRLAKMLAVATVGSALLTFSAAGMAVAGFLRDRAEAISRPNDDANSATLAATRQAAAAPAANKTRRLRIGDVDVVLTKSQFKTLRELTGGGSLDADGLERLLSSLPAELAQRIEEAITVANSEIEASKAEVETVVAATERTLERRKRAAKKAAAQTQQAQEEEESTAPADEPTPQPTPSEDKNGGGGEDGGDTGTEGEEGGDTGAEEEEEGDGGPPLPIKP